MAFNSTPFKEANEKVRNHLAEAAAAPEDKKRKRHHSAVHIDAPDASSGGYIADAEGDSNKKSKKHKKKKTRKSPSSKVLKHIKLEYDDEIDEGPPTKKSRNSASKLVNDEATVDKVIEDDSSKKASPGVKKHKRKLSKDEYEDRRRSPATLKLICLYPSEYTDCESSDERAILITDDEEMTDSEMENPVIAEGLKMGDFNEDSEQDEHQNIKNEDHSWTPILPPARIFDTEYTPTTKKAKTHGVKFTPKNIAVSENAPRQAPDTNDFFDSAVNQMKTTLFDKVKAPRMATTSNRIFAGIGKNIQAGDNGLPIRTKDWETTTGKIRGNINLGDDSEATENIAFSKNYIEATPTNTVRFSGSACRRLVIAAGESTNDLSKHTSDAKDVTICLLVKGGPANISLESNGTHENPFPMSEGGFWSVRGGGICKIHNKGPDEMIVWAVTQGKPDTKTFMTALGTFGRGTA